MVNWSPLGQRGGNTGPGRRRIWMPLGWPRQSKSTQECLELTWLTWIAAVVLANSEVTRTGLTEESKATAYSSSQEWLEYTWLRQGWLQRSVNSGVSETSLTDTVMAAAVSVESGITGKDLTMARIATAVSVNSGVSGTGLIDPGMDAAISVYSGVSETSLTGDSIGGTQVMDETARKGFTLYMYIYIFLIFYLPCCHTFNFLGNEQRHNTVLKVL